MYVNISNTATQNTPLPTLAGPRPPQYAQSELMQQRMKSAAVLSRRKTVQLDDIPEPPVQFINSAFHNFKYILIRTYVAVYRDPKFWFSRFFRICMSCMGTSSSGFSASSACVCLPCPFVFQLHSLCM